MTISEIYSQYKINQGLQEHMLRVAAVAKVVAENTKVELDNELAIKACLLHDMGNILKFDFSIAPDLYEPEGVPYWEEVKVEVREKYGNDVHVATLAMVREIYDDQQVLNILEEAEFENLKTVAESGTPEAKLLEYADMRVGMHSVISLEERFQDIKNRYVPKRFTAEEVDSLYQSAKTIEEELFAEINLTPSDITDESTKAAQQELLNWNL